jgi:hypothetical protein
MFSERANPIAKAIFVASAVTLGCCWVAYLGRQCAKDPEFTLSRIMFDWRDTGFAAFHRLYTRIHVGMTRNDLQQEIGRVYPASGRNKPPRIDAKSSTAITLFMANHGGECILLSLANGRIVSKHYSWD